MALSEPVEDPVYPDVGDPRVDALHYDLDLDWDPAARELSGRQVLTFRAAAGTDHFQLDLGEPLVVDEATLDGEPVAVERRGKDLVVRAPLEEDDRHELALTYSGTPEPVPAPTTRGDFDALGWTITEDGETWTMQEPYGAYTWYAVNDQPADKALYDIEVSVPAPWVGVANGELVERTEAAGVVSTSWHLAEPASSYLVTLATGELTLTEDESASGVPLTYWTPTDRPDLPRRLARTPELLAWVEERLGPYPFDTLGIVVVDSRSGMETQTMITLGDTDYTTSPEVIVHELVHQWWGNQVSPRDWSELWMNEGMAMYLQWVWQAEEYALSDADFEAYLDDRALEEAALRTQAGPFGAYDPEQFGVSNVYYGPALMWHEVRRLLGDDAFWDLVRAWPAARDNATTDRHDFLAWAEDRTQTSLTDLLDAWLLSPTSPPRGGGG